MPNPEDNVIARIDLISRQEVAIDTPVAQGSFHGIIFFDESIDTFGYWTEGVDSDGEEWSDEDGLTYLGDCSTKEEAIDELLSDHTPPATQSD